MIWLLLSTGFAEEETPSQSHDPDSDIVVFHYGLDPVLSAKIALNYVQAVTDYSAERLSPMMMDDVFPVARSQVLQDVSSEHCLDYPVSPLLFTKLVQEMEYSLSYFELDKAQQLSVRAEANLECLSEPPDLATVAELFYLRGLTLYYNNQSELAQEAFLQSFIYKPNMGWNDTYAPDAKDTFEAARKQYADLKAVPLTVYPESAKGRLWINGTPVYRDVPLTLTTGINHVQILGSQIENLTLEIDEETPEVNLVVPSAVDEIGLAWLDKPNKRAEVGTILNLLYPNNPTYFISSKDSVWEYSPSNQEWQEYPIPISAKVFSLDTRRNVGRGLFWGGIAISSVYGSKAAQDYARLTYLGNSGADTWVELNTSYEEFQVTEERYQRSASMTLVGAAATGLGWLMSR